MQRHTAVTGDQPISQGDVLQKTQAVDYYRLLEVPPNASMIEIRSAYRRLSRLYHPDTTQLPPAIATAQFQQLNEAYATLNQPELRAAYDRKLALMTAPVRVPTSPVQRLSQPDPSMIRSRNAYLDPDDRPLSGGELFALLMLAITLVGCLVLALAIGLSRGEIPFPGSTQSSTMQVVNLLFLSHPRSPTIPVFSPIPYGPPFR